MYRFQNKEPSFFFFCSLFYVDTNFLFVNLQIVLSQQTFQRRLNVAFRLIWRRDVAQRQINIETRLRTSTLKSTTFNKVETTLRISTLNWTTLDNVETTLRIWSFQKKNKSASIQKQNNIFEIQGIYWTQNLFQFFLILRGICKTIFANSLKNS